MLTFKSTLPSHLNSSINSKWISKVYQEAAPNSWRHIRLFIARRHLTSAAKVLTMDCSRLEVDSLTSSGKPQRWLVASSGLRRWLVSFGNRVARSSTGLQVVMVLVITGKARIRIRSVIYFSHHDYDYDLFEKKTKRSGSRIKISFY